MGTRRTAHQLLDLVLDTGSYVSWDSDPADVGPDAAYAAALADAHTASGCDEAVLTGEGRLSGHRVAVVACEFGFLAGSVGVAAAERLLDAVERATAEGLPLLAAPASGGTRMQEGTRAFVSMAPIAAAITAHKAAGHPYLVYLRHPTTGGVLASWGSLGHLTAAEPGALIGFLGPRVYEALHGDAFPTGVQSAENLRLHGLVDAVLTPEELGGAAGRALDVLLDRAADDARPPTTPPAAPATRVPTWDSVLRSRRKERPGVRDLLRHAATDVVRLHGTGEGDDDPTLLVALARFGRRPCVLAGQDRSRQGARTPMGPAALLQARRAMRLAAELRLPLVTVIDTPGAELSAAAEERGMAAQIAHCLADMATLGTATVSVLLGEGTGGGAIALLPADRVLCAQHAWLSPLPPEGASAIVHRTVDRAGELAESQGIGSADLLAAGVVDRVIAEDGDAADEDEAFCVRVGDAIAHELATLRPHAEHAPHAGRLGRYRLLGAGV
ncbi:carboxyl transferase domain-containing protein [Nocardiopsis sp. NPDC058631]|uniref:carboxyl transferase domain-containing protein n=1 Tax=Nocardiopsis sp. NPDC058631 TaxID=3346566 RepID=UPI003664B042